MKHRNVSKTDLALAASFEVKSILRPYRAAIKRGEKPSPPITQLPPRRHSLSDAIDFVHFLGLHLSRKANDPHKRYGTAARLRRGHGGMMKRGFRVKHQIHAQIARAQAA